MNPELEVARVFSANLRKHRQLADLSQEKLAIMSQIHLTAISMLERRLRVPKISTAIRIAGSLEVSLDDLVEGISWRAGEFSAGGFQVKEADEPTE